MSKHEGTIRTIVIVLVALVLNAVLDVAFGASLLVRLGVTVAVVVLLTGLIEAVRRRRTQ